MARQRYRAFGFTGTQQGMTDAQKSSFARLVQRVPPDEFHHGDCIGADEQAHALVREYCPTTLVVIHPPTNQNKRAFCEVDDILHEEIGRKTPTTEWKYPFDYLIRNQHIVNFATVLIATPGESKEQLRSGTWSTVRRGRKKGIPVFIILPSGKIRREN